jgi:hypothetical protein
VDTWTTEKRERFLATLREIPNVTAAARAADMARSGAYALRERDAEFKQAWDDAVEEGVDMLEREAQRRAFEGTKKPVIYQGAITDSYLEFSDTLAIFLLKAHRPEKYRDRAEVKIDAADLAEALAAARGRGSLV